MHATLPQNKLYSNCRSSIYLPRQKCLPLETVSVWAGTEKITLDRSDRLRYYAHKQIARHEFHNAKVLASGQFDQVDWEMVHRALTNVPKMFQIFICKQVFDIACTNYWLALFDKTNNTSPLCPSCFQATETAGHILHCEHAGRVEVMLGTIKLLDESQRYRSQATRMLYIPLRHGQRQ